MTSIQNSPNAMRSVIGRIGLAGACLTALTLAACSRIDDILDVAPPVGVQTAGQLDNATGAEAVYYSGKSGALIALASSNSIIQIGGLLSDEFIDGDIAQGGARANIDGRITTPIGRFSESGDYVLSDLVAARSSLLLAAPKLYQYEADDSKSKAGEAYALAGYAEIFIAETYCAGMTLDRVLPGGGWEFNMPLTTDSTFAVAEAHFDSALVYANGDANIIGLANAGLARARLGRGHFAQAAEAAANVPTSFVYNLETSPTSYDGKNLYASGVPGCSMFNTGNREGGVGLDFVSAHDPRLVIDTTVGKTCEANWTDNAAPLYYPIKFGIPSTEIPLASGLEARLIEAEAELQTGDASWLATLNALRTTCTDATTCATPAPAGTGNVAGLPPLADPGLGTLPTGETAKDARADLIFRERAFWLFGTGTRLGDLRRLIRQYGRAANSVFPTGPYAGGAIPDVPSYGEDVSITLPTPASGQFIANPHYQGCLTSTTDG